MNPHKPHIVFNGRWRIANKHPGPGLEWDLWFAAARWCDHVNMKGKPDEKR